MKKIVQILNEFRLLDGMGNVAVARARALIDLGCQVTVICHQADSVAMQPPAPTLLLVSPEQTHNPADIPPAATAAVAQADVVILDVGGYSPLFDLAEGATGRLIVDYHGCTPPGLIRDPYYTMNWYKGVHRLRGLLGRVDLLVTHSQFIAEEWQGTFGDTPAERVVVPLFGATQPGALGPLMPMGDRPLQLLGVGRMFPNKNWELAIRAVERLQARGVLARFEHIGGGADVISRRYRAQLDGLIRDLGVQEHILLRGAVAQPALEAAYAGCDAVVLPSLHEGFALPAVEALACGKPVFASELGALGETLGGAGQRLNPFDPVAWAEAIATYFQQSAPIRQGLAEQGQARARELSREAFAKRYVELIMPATASAAKLAPPPVWSARAAAGATLTVELAEQYVERLPFLEGTVTVAGLTAPLPLEVQLAAHVIDAAGRLLQYCEVPTQTRRGEATAPRFDFRLLLTRSDRPHRVLFQLAQPLAGGGRSGDASVAGEVTRADFFGRPGVVELPARDGEPPALEKAQQILQISQHLADLNFELRYPTGTLPEKIKSYIARNLTSRLQSRYLQPHVELQGELNRLFVELLGLLLTESNDRAQS